MDNSWGTTLYFKAFEKALHAFIDNLQLFGLGVSWGGNESLALPFSPAGRTSAKWPYAGPGVRIHIGLEDPSDLIEDLERGFAAMAAAAQTGDAEVSLDQTA